MGRISFSTIKNWNLFSSVIYRVQISSLRPFAKTREQTHFFGQHHVSSIMYHTPIKLVSLDLDGTTLNNDHKFSDRTVQILKRLSASGVIITLASGRSTLDISKHFDVLDLPQQIEPGVSYNGAFGFVREHHEGEKVGLRKIFERPVNSELADDLISFASELGHVLHVSEPRALYISFLLSVMLSTFLLRAVLQRRNRRGVRSAKERRAPRSPGSICSAS